MAKIESFRFWCQKVLPLVYDDSLSYYELLCKVVKYLNDVIEAVNENTSGMEALRDYVNNYFNNLDVQEEINNKMDQLVEDGTMDSIVERYLINLSKVNGVVNAKYYGVVPESADIYENLSNLITLAKSNGFKIFIEPGTYNNSDWIFTDDTLVNSEGTVPKLVISKSFNNNGFRRFMWNRFPFTRFLDDITGFSFQSACYMSDTNNYALLFRNTNTADGKIVIVNTGFTVQRSATLDIGHANGCCYNPNTGLIYIATGSEGAYAYNVIGVDPISLEVEFQKSLDAQAISGIAYDSTHDIYYVLTGNVTAYDSEFNLLKVVGHYSRMANYCEPNSHYQSQSIGMVGDNLIFSSNQQQTDLRWYKRANLNTFNFDNSQMKDYWTYRSFNHADELEMVCGSHSPNWFIGFGAENSELLRTKHLNLYGFYLNDLESDYADDITVDGKIEPGSNVEFTSYQINKKNGIVTVTVTVKALDTIAAYATLGQVDYRFRPSNERVYVAGSSGVMFAIKDDGTFQAFSQLTSGSSYQFTATYLALDIN